VRGCDASAANEAGYCGGAIVVVDGGKGRVGSHIHQFRSLCVTLIELAQSEPARGVLTMFHHLKFRKYCRRNGVEMRDTSGEGYEHQRRDRRVRRWTFVLKDPTLEDQLIFLLLRKFPSAKWRNGKCPPWGPTLFILAIVSSIPSVQTQPRISVLGFGRRRKQPPNSPPPKSESLVPA